METEFRTPVLSAFADEASPELSGQIAAMRRNGISGLEVRGVDGKSVSDLTLSEAREIRARLEGEGLFAWSAGSPMGKIGITDPFEPHLEKFRHTLEVTRELGAERMRMFSFFLPKEDDPAAWKNAVLDRLAQFCEAADGSGVFLCHENEKGIYGDVASRCAEIHAALPGLRAVFDPANFIQCGQDTLEAWDLLGDLVDYMHIKDALPDGIVVPCGKGAGHVPEIIAAFRSRGGDHFTLEPHLTVFDGLGALERDGIRSGICEFAYPTADAAFDAACAALKTYLN